MKKFLSKSLGVLAPSISQQLGTKIQDLKNNNIDVIDLSLGDPDFVTPDNISKAAIAAIESKKFFKYGPHAGYKELREAIAKKLQDDNNINCSYKNIVVSNGVRQSIANVFTALLNRDDEVAVFTPYWVSYAANILLAGGIPKKLIGPTDNISEPTIETIKKNISDKTKILMFSNPGNPTGHVLKKHYLLAIADIMRENPNLILVSDEICEKIIFEGKLFSPGSIEDIADRVITLNGVSKTYAMTGWRIGYMCANEDIANACITIQSHTTAAPCGISQVAALEALRGDQSAVQEMVNSYKERSQYVFDYLTKHSELISIKPKGAIYFFSSIEKYIGKKTADGKEILSSIDIVSYLLQNAHVVVVASDDFGMPNYIRISYATDFNLLKVAIAKICKALGELI